MSYTFYVIGRDHILIGCAKTLQKLGFVLLGVISQDSECEQWALREQIKVYKDYRSFVDEVNSASYDFLFSINNLSILPDDVIRHPARLAINYHNALLPSYAGLNATSWAILNDEIEHGITWHIMSERVDQGNVLVQRSFAIDAQDTSGSLAKKCFVAAVDSLGQLVKVITQNHVQGSVQAGEGRSYYGAKNRPSNEGVICWREKASHIYRLYRALNAGDNKVNDFCTPKLLVDQMLLIINSMCVGERCSQAQPGTVIDVTENAIIVSSLDYDLVISKLYTMQGGLLCGEDLKNLFYPSQVLPVIQGDLTGFNIAKHGVDSTTALFNFAEEVFDLNCYKGFSDFSDEFHQCSVRITMPPVYRSYTDVLTVLCIYLCKVFNVDSLSFVYSNKRLVDTYKKSFGLVSWQYPVVIKNVLSKSFDETRRLICDCLGSDNMLGLVRDMGYRYLSAKHKVVQALFGELPDYIADQGASDHVIVLEGGNVCFAIEANADQYCIKVFFKKLRAPEFVNDINDRLFKKMGEHLHAVVDAIKSGGDANYTKLNLLSSAEVKSLKSFNTGFSKNESNHILNDISRSFDLYESKIAVVDVKNKLTYGDIDRMSDVVCHYFLDQDYKPNSIVGVYLCRDALAIVIMLGILKAGHAYLPLNTLAPINFVSEVVKDAEPVLVLASEKYLSLLKNHLDVQVDSVSSVLEFSNNVSQPNAHVFIKKDSLAYVIYTSGSTGKPKGVRVTHANLVNFIFAMQQHLQLEPYMRYLHVGQFHFDISVFECFFPLVYGGTIMIASQAVIDHPVRLVEFIVYHGCQVIQATPSLWQLLVSSGLPSIPHSTGLCGGENISAFEIAHIQNCVERFFHVYGPTEATVWATITENPIYEGEVNIGKPLQNMAVNVVDRYGCLLPMGAAGELIITGEGVASGYMGGIYPSKFSDFIAGRFDQCYRTGDYGYYLPNGCLKFVGRQDDQIKLNGYRIELGYVESTLYQTGLVQQAVVLVVSNKLVAFVVSEASSADIMDLLCKSLPSYMIPAQIQHLMQMPLTLNGKLNKALLKQMIGKPVSPVMSMGGEIEDMLMGFLSQELGHAKVSADIDFADMGVGSLMYLSVLNRINHHFDIQMTLNDIFRASSIRSLSKAIRQMIADGSTDLPPFKHWPASEVYPMSFAQQRLFYLEGLLEDPVYNVSFAVKASGVLDKDKLSMSLSEIIYRHQALRSCYRLNNDAPVQQVLENPPICFINRLMHDRYEQSDLQELISECNDCRFDLSVGQLVRLTCLEFVDSVSVLVFSFHHIVFDGCSIPVFARDFSRFYNNVALGDKEVVYGDFANWEHQLVSSDYFEQGMVFWQKQLKGFIGKQALKVKDLHGFRQSRLVASLDVDIVNQVDSLAEKYGLTSFMIYLSVFIVTVARIFSLQSVPCIVPYVNRGAKGLEDIVGFFVNMLPFNFLLHDALSYKDVFFAVKKLLLEGFSFSQIPFDKMIERVNPKRESSSMPLLNVAFSYEVWEYFNLDLSEMQCEPIDYLPTYTQLPLTLFVRPEKEGVQLKCEYIEECFDSDLVEKMLSDYVHNMQVMINQVDQLIHLPTIYPCHAPQDNLYQSIFCQIENNPNGIAVVDGEEISYRQLHDFIVATYGEIKRYFLSRNIGDGVVAIISGSEWRMIGAAFAILAAGLKCVLIDSSSGNDRVESIINNAMPDLIFMSSNVDANTLNHLDEVCPVIGLSDIHAQECKPDGQCKLMPLVDGNHEAAFIYYTSGTTGEPKGVCVTHANIINLVLNQTEVQLQPEDVVISISSPGFDAFLFNMCIALLNGATIVLVPKVCLLDTETLHRIITKNKATLLLMTPALLVAHYKNKSDMFSELKYLIVGGDVFPVGVLNSMNNGPHRPEHIFNAYGPTENTVIATLYEVECGRVYQDVPIGVPIVNVQALVLDEDLKQVPDGEAGLLYLAGSSLSPGYYAPVHSSGFVEDYKDFSLIYNTGDLVKRVEGLLYYIGRRDHMVKINGIRVDLNVINQYLMKLPYIDNALVVTIDHHGTKDIVAFVVADKKKYVDFNHGVSQVEEWQKLYNAVYEDLIFGEDDATVGWNSSYTGMPLPKQEMDEWVSGVLQRISELPAKKVLEVGCGSGLILAGLIEQVEKYVGIDISQSSVNYLLAKYQGAPVHIETKHAHSLNDYSAIYENYFDTVVINSTIQYFPNVEYLESVITEAMALMQDQSYLFIGDVLNYNLMEDFYKSIAEFKGLSEEDSHSFIQESMANESELYIAPEYFFQLEKKIPEIRRVVARSKAGCYQNEMNQYRYDVVLYIDKDNMNVGTGSLNESLAESFSNIYLHLASCCCQPRFGALTLQDMSEDVKCEIITTSLNVHELYNAPAILGNTHDVIESMKVFLREHIANESMPRYFISLDEMPLTSSGKVDAKQLRQQFLDDLDDQGSAAEDGVAVKSKIASFWKELLLHDDFNRNSVFFDVGGHSILLVSLLSKLKDLGFGGLKITDLINYPTINQLGDYLSGARLQQTVASEVELPKLDAREDVAIVGVAARVPGADNVEAFWDNLLNVRDSINRVQPEYKKKGFAYARGLLKDYDKFDYKFFGLSKKEAQLLDPQQRIFLELCWHLFQDAGLNPLDQEANNIGVFVSSGASYYLLNNIIRNDTLDIPEDILINLYNDKDTLAGRIAYYYHLNGPAVNVQTACSSSLVAVDLAIKSLQQAECDMVVAGGVNLLVPQTNQYQPAGIQSKTGYCRPFDNDADGTVFGSGAGAVLLQRYSDAVRDGRKIYGVIIGSAVNNDGAQKAGFIAPSQFAQERLLAEALKKAHAGVADKVGYFEAHGTGTIIGDELEINAIQAVYGNKADIKLGSVKANIGHLGAAAGIVGLVKVALMISRGMVPGQPNFREANAHLVAAADCLSVAKTSVPWQQLLSNRYAAITSLGAGGTNVHMLVQGRSANSINETVNGNIFCYSAHSLESMAGFISALSSKAQDVSADALIDLVAAVTKRSANFPYRCLFKFSGRNNFLSQLSSWKRATVHVKETQDQLLLILPPLNALHGLHLSRCTFGGNQRAWDGYQSLLQEVACILDEMCVGGVGRHALIAGFVSLASLLTFIKRHLLSKVVIIASGDACVVSQYLAGVTSLKQAIEYLLHAKNRIQLLSECVGSRSINAVTYMNLSVQCQHPSDMLDLVTTSPNLLNASINFVDVFNIHKERFEVASSLFEHQDFLCKLTALWLQGYDICFAPYMNCFINELVPRYVFERHVAWVDPCPKDMNLGDNHADNLHQAALPAIDEDVISQVKQIWEHCLGIENITIAQTYIDLGGNSLIAVDILEKIEQQFGVQVPIDHMGDSASIEKIAKFVRDRQDSILHSGLISELKAGVGAPIICFHAMVSDLNIYKHLVQQLNISNPVIGIHSYHLLTGDYTYASISSLVEFYLQDLSKFYDLNNAVLLGWSFGGVLACEAAAQLEKQSVTLRKLVMIDSYLVDTIGVDAIEQYKKTIMRRAKNICMNGQQELRLHDTLNHEIKMLQNFQPPPTAVSATLFVAIDNAKLSTKMVNKNIAMWQASIANLDCVHLAADHYSIMQEGALLSWLSKLVD